MKRNLKWLLPLLFALVIAPFTPEIDLGVARFFFKEGHFVDNALTKFLYRYGERTGFFFASCTIIAYILSWIKPRWHHLRKPALALALTWFLGAGLIIHTGFKENWGRARPRQITEFGGKHTYSPFYVPDFQSLESKKSFPSGHVAVGFYYLSFCLIGFREKSRRLFLLGLVLTLLFAPTLFCCRLAQGAHFFSDALFSALIMWWTALFCEWLVYTAFPKLHRKFFGDFERT